ncbi:UvrD-helicase domain-containing protein [bacterium]|nr:UvrD-helicase domain-containing protein [bacterium]
MSDSNSLSSQHAAEELQHNLEQRDIEARSEALEPGYSCIVQAPAGSGKTELLIQRFLVLLAAVDAPEEIIAITFTRKASAEMRVRIMLALAEAESGAEVEGHAAVTRTLAERVLARDAERKWHLRDQPSRLRIMTIDALNGWIVRQMPWLSGMGGVPAIADDAMELYREAVRRSMLDDVHDVERRAHITRLLEHLDNRYGTIESLLAQMLAIREQWMDLVSEEVEIPREARSIIERSLTSIVTAQLQKLCALLPEEERREIAALGQHAARQLEAREDRNAGAMAGFLSGPTELNETPESLASWQAAAQLLLTGSDTLRSPRGINRTLGFERDDTEKPRMLALVGRLEGQDECIALLQDIRRLPSPRFTDAQWDILSSILEVLRYCVGELQSLFTQRGMVDHAEVAASALRALGSELDPTDLAMMLEYRIQHILVDEFQDTSAGQYRLLSLLTTGWMPDDGHSLFLVGDPMQSIYRFREAEVGLFLSIWEDARIGSVPLRTLRLYRNFRSQAGIVQWVNEVFAQVMPARSDPASGAVTYVPSAPAKPENGEAVRFMPVYSGDRADEAAGIVSLLRELGHGRSEVTAEETAILVRSRSHLAYVIPALREAGIAFQAVDIEALGAHPAVQDILALTRALLHMADSTAWLAVLRAPFCGLQLSDLHALTALRGERTVLDAIHDAIVKEEYSEDAGIRLRRIMPVLDEAMGEAGRRPLRLLVERCWIGLGGPACVDAQGFDAVASYFDMLEMLVPGANLDNLRELHEGIEKLFAPPDQGDALRLQVMTIHRAKGLQFDHVIIPRLDGTPPVREERLMIWMDDPGAKGSGFIIAPLRERGTEKEATYAYVQRRLAEKEEHEYQRLLYVAVTRARRRLYLSATLRMKEDDQQGFVLQKPARNSFLSAIWPAVEDEAQRQSAAWLTSAQEEDVISRPEIRLRRLRDGWEPPALPPPLPVRASIDVEDVSHPETSELPWHAGEEARLRGTAVHRVLAWIGAHGLAAWEEKSTDEQVSTVTRVLEHGGSAGTGLTRAVIDAVQAVTGEEMGRWLLAAHPEARSEWALTVHHAGRNERVIIDRTFVDEEGTRWIVDFKSAVHEGADLEGFLDAQLRMHRAQLQRYGEILRAFDARPQRLLVYFPMYRTWREL